jgi:hypothetical protein
MVGAEPLADDWAGSVLLRSLNLLVPRVPASCRHVARALERTRGKSCSPLMPIEFLKKSTRDLVTFLESGTTNETEELV